MSNMGSILENKVAPKYKIMTFQKPFIESLYDVIKFMMAALGVELVAPAIAAATSVPVSSKQKAKKPVSIPPSTTSQGGTAVSMTRRGISVSGNYSGGSKGTLTLLAGSNIDMGAKIQAKDKGTPTLRQQLLAQEKLIN